MIKRYRVVAGGARPHTMLARVRGIEAVSRKERSKGRKSKTKWRRLESENGDKRGERKKAER